MLMYKFISQNLTKILQFKGLIMIDFTTNSELTRGTICVLRSIGGKFKALSIPQKDYREWLGCFSLL